MAHHSDRNPIVEKALREELEKSLKKEMEEPLARAKRIEEDLGATGRYPEGKLGEHDEGEIRFGVANYLGRVIVDFGKPVRSLGMLPEQARELGRLLIDKADNG